MGVKCGGHEQWNLVVCGGLLVGNVIEFMVEKEGARAKYARECISLADGSGEGAPG